MAGLFDGEGCLTASIERDKRKGSQSETGGWGITFCAQFTNSDDAVVERASELLRATDYHPRIQRYPTGAFSHIRLFRQEEVRRLCEELISLSNGSKKTQMRIFLEQVVPLMGLRPELSRNNHERIWTRQLFIQVVQAVDRMSAFKRRRLPRHKYDQEFFMKLWSPS